MRLVDELVHFEAVEPHEPIGLVQAMFAVQLDRPGGREPRVLVNGKVCAEEHALKVVRRVQGGGQVEDLEIGFGRGADDHLRRLPGRGKGLLLTRNADLLLVDRGFSTHKRAGFGIFGDVVPDLAHGRQYGLPGLLRR